MGKPPRRRKPEVAIRREGRDAPARRALQVALLDQIRLDHVFDRRALFADRGGDVVEADRAAADGVLSSAAMVDLYSQIYAQPDITGDWATAAASLRTAYVGWAENSISQRQFLGVAVRFVAMYVVLTFFLLS